MRLPQYESGQAAHALGYRAIFLSTYLDVPWNAPFYTRRGFAEVPRGHRDWPMRLQFAMENSHGHPSWLRTVMSREV